GLGNDTLISSTIPVDVVGLSTGVEAIVAGGVHTCAIQTGAAFCWGGNQHGALGAGTAGGIQASPLPVAGFDVGVTQLAAYGGATIAIHNQGAKVWGDGSHGLVGNGNASDATVPTQVSGLATNIIDVDLYTHWNTGHACAVAADGSVWCWGADMNGQLGSGRPLLSAVPMEVFYIGAFLVAGLTGGVDAVVDATLGDAAPTVHWGESERAVSYEVRIRDAADGADVCGPATVSATSHTFAGCSLPTGTGFIVRVSASDGNQVQAAYNAPFEFVTSY
ncbi:MAG: hypothetical protein M3094_00885, partial [Actinomycetia bacterium]|nr:hypothetical protein [Actinomycetes bacterium]